MNPNKKSDSTANSRFSETSAPSISNSLPTNYTPKKPKSSQLPTNYSKNFPLEKGSRIYRSGTSFPLVTALSFRTKAALTSPPSLSKQKANSYNGRAGLVLEIKKSLKSIWWSVLRKWKRSAHPKRLRL
jgi:hypothetical protein